MQLSQKQKSFSQFLFTLWKSRFNSEHFLKKDDPHSLCIGKVRDSKKHGSINV